MNRNYDIVIIGGGIIGLATGYYLSRKGINLAIVERKYIGSGSTGRCIGGIRQQFSTPTAIRLMKESVQLFSQMEEEFGFPVEFFQGGYLLLAHSEKMVNIFKANIEIQKKEKVNVSLLTPEEAKKIVPHLNIDGVHAAAYCPDDGQAFPFAVLKGYKQQIEKKAGNFILYNKVEKIEKKKHFSLTLQDGSVIESEKVLLSAGPWTAEIANTIGLSLPLYPERHEAIITERMPRFLDPMVVDYREDGCYFNQFVTGQICGCYTPIPNVPGIREDASFEFVPNIAWRMARLVPAIKNASILRHWAGSYTMTPDGSPIVGETQIEGLYLASGMSGHGFMFGPATSFHLAHYIATGEWDTDFSEFSIARSFESRESLK
jgi:sarcosine oxidase subunit beta